MGEGRSEEGGDERRREEKEGNRVLIGERRREEGAESRELGRGNIMVSNQFGGV